MAVEMQSNQQPVGATSGIVVQTASDQPPPAKTPLRRACDCCRKRKVKCDGDNPCGPCKKASIHCSYLQPPKKKGPKGLRSARVLHALRRIDDAANGYATSTAHHGGFTENWAWSTATSSPTGMRHPELAIPPAQVTYGPHDAPNSSEAQDEHFYSQGAPTTMPQPQSMPPTTHLNHSPLYRSDTHQSTWTPHHCVHSAPSNASHDISPIAAEPMPYRISGESFLPYIRLFFDHMFPIMPVIDRSVYLDHNLYATCNSWSPDTYCFLCALCAATIVQLDASIPQPSPLVPNKATDDFFAEECLRERKLYDYVDSASTLSIMTSFFLFAYYGNHEQHAKAWYYLQESITYCESLNLEDEQSYGKLDPVEAQWRRRLYWLLFITERAYAVQRRKHCRLHANVALPAVFESEDPHLLNGFVNLANLFSAVDDSFVSAWRGSRRQSLCNEAWLANTQKQLDAAALALDQNTSETQQLDISITREWLHMLAWQMGVSNGLIWGNNDGGMRLDYPIELARKVVEITSGANALALDSHGIGMEQKLSDIAGCLVDVLRCTAGDASATFLEGKQYLNTLLQRLSSIRGKESRYLKPLMAKVEGLMGYELNNQTLPLPTETPSTFTPPISSEYLPTGPRFSMADSLGMLRTLSMSGNLGMPALAVPLAPHEDWQQRRPSGRVYDEYETKAMGPWLMDEQAA